MYQSLASPFTPADPAPLATLLANVCESHFARHLESHVERQAPTQIRWAIPHETIVQRLITTCHKQPSSQNSEPIQFHEIAFKYAKRLLTEGLWDEAAKALKYPADDGYAEAELLLSHLLKRLQGDWEPYAKRYAERFQTITLVPASGFDITTDSVILHPYLAHRRAPRFVLFYLIHHECARHQFHAKTQIYTSPDFLRCERNAPHRDKAIRWLCQQGFPVFTLEPLSSQTSMYAHD